MTKCIIGTQTWYDERRQRLVDISKELRTVNELTDSERDELYNEQNDIICELFDNETDGLINNPLNV